MISDIECKYVLGTLLLNTSEAPHLFFYISIPQVIPRTLAAVHCISTRAAYRRASGSSKVSARCDPSRPRPSRAWTTPKPGDPGIEELDMLML